MKDHAASADGHALAAHYEALRQFVVDSGERSYTVRGRALLMCKGMAAWMKGVDVASAQAVAPTAAGSQQPLATGIKRRLIEILATMALATAMEGTA